jgi:hypothetical protein
MMMLVLPDKSAWREEVRLVYCTCCSTVVPASNDKLIKPHCKSRIHTRALQLQAIGEQQAEAALQSSKAAGTPLMTYASSTAGGVVAAQRRSTGSNN